MKIVSVYKLRDNLAYYLDLVSTTETPIVIEKYNTPAALIVPYKEEVIKANIDSYFGFLGKGESGTKFLKKVRRTKKEKERVKLLRYRNA